MGDYQVWTQDGREATTSLLAPLLPTREDGYSRFRIYLFLSDRSLRLAGRCLVSHYMYFLSAVSLLPIILGGGGMISPVWALFEL
jgi:hypothetical protein